MIMKMCDLIIACCSAGFTKVSKKENSLVTIIPCII